VWRLADFLLQGFVFLLIGQQIVPVLHGLHDYSAGTIITAVAVSLAAALVLRPLWLVMMAGPLRAVRARLAGTVAANEARPDRRDRRDRRRLTAREIGVLSWAGTRGVISLAAIFTVPLAVSGEQPFPGRDLLLFCTFLVVVVTLVGQGLTFGLVTRMLGVRADPADEAWLRWEARAAAVRAGLARLDQIAASGEVGGPALATLRVSLEHGAGLYRQQSPLAAHDDAALQARREVIDAQREELLRWRDAGHLPDASLRVLQRELDHEERTLPPYSGH
jgi:monovalent cation/hydrogen antiporter